MKEATVLWGTPGGRILIGVVGAIAAFTVIGLLVLWPYGWAPAGGASSPVVSAKVLEVVESDCGGPVCVRLVVDVEGRRADVGVGYTSARPDVHVGDTVR